MRIVLYFDPSPIELGETNSGARFPYLKSVGELRTAARAGEQTGIAGTESASVPVKLDNRYKRAARIIRRPVRVPADIFDDADELLFSGIVSSIVYDGTAIDLSIDA